eukprot:2794616-Alexandrium_andersonii.AAC.1
MLPAWHCAARVATRYTARERDLEKWLCAGTVPPQPGKHVFIHAWIDEASKSHALKRCLRVGPAPRPDRGRVFVAGLHPP